MKNLIILEHVYQSLREHHLCSSAYDFSERFLGKSKSYYSVLKATHGEPSLAVMMNLEYSLRTTAKLYDHGIDLQLAKNKQILDELSGYVAIHRQNRELVDYQCF